MSGLKLIAKSGKGIGVLILVVVCINIIASRLHGRVDVTSEKVYTLSQGTNDIIHDLKDDVEVKFYFSRSIKDLPVQFKTYASRVEEVLLEYAARSGGHISVAVVDPKPDTDDEEWARKYGIQGVPLPSGTEMFFGVVFLRGNVETAIPFFDPRREEFLEYDLSEALLRSEKSDKPKVGIISSMPIMRDATLGDMQQDGPNEWAFVSELRKSFDLSEILATSTSIPKDVAALIVYHPKDLSEGALYAIDQYVLNGGRMIAAVDPMSRIDLMHQSRMEGQNPGAPRDTSSNLKKLFDAWGIVYDSQKLVGDSENSVQINAGGQEMLYPFFINFTNSGLSKTSVITANLTSFMYAEGGSIDLVQGSTAKLEPLITTSKSAGLVGPGYGGFSNPMMLVSQLKAGDKPLVLAGIVTGKFKTAFPQGLPQKSDSAPGDAQIMEAEKESAVLVVADTDFIFDNNAVDKMRFLNQIMLRPKNGNLAFMINAVDYLGGSPALISIRSKGRIARPFTVVDDLQRKAQDHWKKVEDDLSNQINELQRKLSDLQAQRADGSSLQMTPEQQAEISKFREEERQVRRKRREVRKNLREEIESLGNKLAAANLVIVPSLVSVFGISSMVKRSRKGQRRKVHGK
jgi:ABC-type uncharacterized transport system involved in gliding motility auxiliary subunit